MLAKEDSEILKRPTFDSEIIPFWHSGWFVAGVLFLLCLVAYFNSLNGHFVYDDYSTIRFNLSLRENDWTKIALHMPSRPLAALTFALNYKLSGMYTMPYHAANLIFHFASVFLFFLLLRRVSTVFWFAMVASGLMAIHPLNTESVSYITSRFILICAMFYFSSLLFLDTYLKRPSSGSLIGFVTCFILAALSKENAAAIPVIAVLYALLFYGREAVLRNKILFSSILILTLGGALFRIFVFLGPREAPPFFVYWPTEIGVWVRYLWLAIYPVSLNVEHDVGPLVLTSGWFLGSLLIVASLCFLLWRVRVKHPILAFWGLWFFVNLLPSSIVPLHEFMAEHTTYISLFGFCACVSYGLILFAMPLAKPKALVGIVIFILSAAYLFGTIHRNRDWQDQLSLWSDAVAKSPKRVRPHLNLANAYIDAKLYDKAINEYSLALSYFPRSKEAFSGMGVANLRMGAVSWAEENFRKALSIDPNFTDAKVGLGLVNYENELCDQTLLYLESVYPMRWESAEVVTAMADCYAKTGKIEDAIRVLKRPIEANTPVGSLYAALMEAYYIGKHHKEALEVFDRYKSRFPEIPLTELRVAAMLKDLGRREQAKVLLVQLTGDLQYGSTAKHLLKELEAYPATEKK